MLVNDLLERSAKRFPDRIAIVAGNTRMTYAQLDRKASQVANLLAGLGVQPHDRVALSCPNVPQFSVAYYGILKAGAAVVPLNVLLKRREVSYHLQDSGAKVFLCFVGDGLPLEGHRGYLDSQEHGGSCEHFVVLGTGDGRGTAAELPVGLTILEQAIAEQPTTFPKATVDEDDTAVILYTSGTTGRPKGAELRHRNMRDNALACEALFQTSPHRPDTYLATLPLFHSFGQTVVQNGAFATGGTVVMLTRFDPRKALKLMLAERITFFAGVPTMYWGLLRALDDPDGGAPIDVAAIAQHLRIAAAGGAPLPAEVHGAFEKHFGTAVLEGYGLSETSPIASFVRYGEQTRIGSIGRPIPGVEMKLIDPNPGRWNEIAWTPDAVGEIAIRGHNVMKGYLDKPEATTESINCGWFRSGDLARRDQDGWYYIVDRSKDVIIRGGYNVYPREIEEQLMSHPHISLAAVVGVPDPRHGEEVKAFVIPTEGTSLTPADVLDWGESTLASYKYPRLVEIVDTLPMTATGKILKRSLG